MIREIDPLSDARWPGLISGHPDASVFHTREWLEAIRRTYGHVPAAITMSPENSDLTNAIVFFRVHSWLTGRRLVSLPFSDHCNPLVRNDGELAELLSDLRNRTASEHCRYAEIRAVNEPGDWPISEDFYFHRLDLRPGADAVFRRFHRDCIQRKIRRAEKEGISIVVGRDESAIQAFYRLVVQTRKRQGLPPQPRIWFRNLMQSLGGNALIRCAYQGDRPIAGILTLRHGRTIYYKYGASDARFHNLGAMPYLFWNAIREAIGEGMEEMDLGRSDRETLGLIQFKDRLGAESSILSYRRTRVNPSSYPSWLLQFAHSAFQHMPDRCLIAVGALSYRHLG